MMSEQSELETSQNGSQISVDDRRCEVSRGIPVSYLTPKIKKKDFNRRLRV